MTLKKARLGASGGVGHIIRSFLAPILRREALKDPAGFACGTFPMIPGCRDSAPASERRSSSNGQP